MENRHDQAPAVTRRGGTAVRATWKPHEKHGDLTERGDLPDSVFAYPKERKEPMTDASHVRNAIARFDQVTDVSDAERELAFANIKKAAKHYDVDMSEKDWHELGRRPSTGRTKPARKKAARKAAATRKKTATSKKTATKKSSAKKKSTTARKKR
jgi:hypothetical protein